MKSLKMKWKHFFGIAFFSFLFGCGFLFEVILSRNTTYPKVGRVIFLEVRDNSFIRYIDKIAVIPYVLHMPFTFPVIWMKEAVALTVEIEGFYAELIT